MLVPLHFCLIVFIFFGQLQVKTSSREVLVRMRTTVLLIITLCSVCSMKTRLFCLLTCRRCPLPVHYRSERVFRVVAMNGCLSMTSRPTMIKYNEEGIIVQWTYFATRLKAKLLEGSCTCPLLRGFGWTLGKIRNRTETMDMSILKYTTRGTGIMWWMVSLFRAHQVLWR